ncbi:MAG: hypothetical protein ACFB22_14310 [Rhodothalassiaceae bacterium]
MSRRVWNRRRRAIFLDVLRRTGNVSAAARAADVSRRAAYAFRERDTDFAQDWAEAVNESLDDLEQALRQRAVSGTLKPVYYAGKACGNVPNYSDQAGMFLLKARRPEAFGDSGEEADAADQAREKLREALNAMADRLADGDDGA